MQVAVITGFKLLANTLRTRVYAHVGGCMKKREGREWGETGQEKIARGAVGREENGGKKATHNTDDLSHVISNYSDFLFRKTVYS